MNEPLRLRAGLHLLDHQIVDRDGELAGKVDDLEIEIDPNTGAPVVTAILSGLGAVAHRVGGRFGSALEALEARVAETDTPSRVAFDLIEKIGSHVTVVASRTDLQTNRAEQWARDTIIDHIPGSGHAPE